MTRLQIIKNFFLERVFYSPDGCWYWTGKQTQFGYGEVELPRINYRDRAHRVSYMLLHGKKIPKNLLGCHSCDNRLCVNPYHVFPGTHKDNTGDMVKKNRQASQRRRVVVTDDQLIELRSVPALKKYIAPIAAKHGLKFVTANCAARYGHKHIPLFNPKPLP